MARSVFVAGLMSAFLLAAGGCHEWFINRADREVSQLIESRQRAALGETHPVDIGTETGRIRWTESMYSFAPHPADPEVPEAFRSATTPRPVSPQTTTGPAATTSAPAEPADAETQPTVEPLRFTLSDCLAYAQGQAREYQTAKEDLYLAALALSLERFLWTPQLSGQLSLDYTNSGQVTDFDRAMTAVATIAAEQRLPLGGTVTAQVIDQWVRDLKTHTTLGETGQMILSADIPLLRGAGRVAYESRYQAERDLIYAVRDFERFRRGFLVDIAGDFYRLLALHIQIGSAEFQVESLAKEYQRAQARADKEKIQQFEADRARVDLLNARNRLASTQEIYGSALDLFKIRLNMSTDAPLSLVDEDVDLYEPEVTEGEAIATALKYRLDLLNAWDAVDDARRGVLVAKNNLLPDFDFTGSVAVDTKPGKPNTLEYNTERTTWQGMLELEIPVNRQEERNDFRSALIDLRRAERNHDEFEDQVRAAVRRALRRIALARISVDIQRESIVISEFRRAQVQARADLGKMESTRDTVEAEDALREAKNRFADAESDYRSTILEFLLAAGVLRVGEDGKWVTFEPQP